LFPPRENIRHRKLITLNRNGIRRILDVCKEELLVAMIADESRIPNPRVDEDLEVLITARTVG